MMYDLAEVFPGTGVQAARPGTSLLVTGSTRDTRGACLDALARAHREETDEYTVAITTTRSADDVVDTIRRRADAFDPARLGIVDTTAGDAAVPGVAVESLGSSGDLTGISLSTAKLIQGFNDDAPVRLGLISVSTLLMYVDLQTVFRFLHVFTSRVNSGGWFGAFSMDTDMHDTQAVSTVRAAFDAELHITDDGMEIQGDGLLTD